MTRRLERADTSRGEGEQQLRVEGLGQMSPTEFAAIPNQEDWAEATAVMEGETGYSGMERVELLRGEGEQQLGVKDGQGRPPEEHSLLNKRDKICLHKLLHVISKSAVFLQI